MRPRSAAKVLADATSALVRDHDVTDSLARLLGDCAEADRVGTALAGRTVVEQAKGVIAQQRGVDIPSAYDLLIGVASQRQASLSVVAEDFVRMAQHGSLPG